MGEKVLGIIFAVTVSCAMVFVGCASRKNNSSNNVKPPVKTKQEESPYKQYGYNIDKGLSKYKTALQNSSTEKVKIYCIGESNTRGEFSSDEVNKSWVGVMKSALQKEYGNAGEGFISIYEGALPTGTKGRWTLGNGWSVPGASREYISNVGGFGGCFGCSNKNTTTATLTFTGTKIDLLYSKATDGGTATITIDGKEVGTINCLDKAVSFSNKASYSDLNNSAHTLVITPQAKENVFIEGAIASSNTTGIEVDKIAISSKVASYFNTPLTKEVWDVLPPPDLVLLSFGINESGRGAPVQDFKTDMTALVTYWQGRGSNVCLVPNQKPEDTWTKNWADYVNAMYEIANTNNAGVIDIYKAYFKDYATAQKEGLFGLKVNDYSGGSGTNAAHPGDKGYKYIGEVIYINLR